MSWKLSSANEKIVREFVWSEKGGIKFNGNPEETNTDVFSKFAQTAIGAITLNTFFNQVLALSDPSSIMSLSTSSEVKKEGNTLELTLRSTLPGLRDFLVRWAFQENNSKIISWYLGSATESHLLKFTSIKKDQNK